MTMFTLADLIYPPQAIAKHCQPQIPDLGKRSLQRNYNKGEVSVTGTPILDFERQLPAHEYLYEEQVSL